MGAHIFNCNCNCVIADSQNPLRIHGRNLIVSIISLLIQRNTIVTKLQLPYHIETLAAIDKTHLYLTTNLTKKTNYMSLRFNSFNSLFIPNKCRIVET